MGPQHRKASPLRLLTQRLSKTPTKQLPQAIPSLIALLVESNGDLTSQEQTTLRKASQGADDGVVSYRFKTQISTLLQDRHSTSRWAAVVLVKTFVEVGGLDALQGSYSWVRTIVGYLGQKNEHPAVKRVSVMALTQVFFLTYDVSTLVREITTPTLQSFIPYCLSSLSSGKAADCRVHSGPKLLKAIIQAFILLLPRHPASFRPYLNELRILLSRMIAPAPSDTAKSDVFHPSDVICGLARRLLALLPYCATKGGSAEEWSKNTDALLQNITRTADHIFRSVRENTAAADQRAYAESLKSYKSILSDDTADFLHLEPWLGIYAGSERIIGCLKTLEAFVATMSQTSLALPVAAIWGIIDRLLSVNAPFKTPSGEEITPHLNPEVTRDEREGLWSQLAHIHVAAFEVTLALLKRLGGSARNLTDIILDRLSWIFEREHAHKIVRRTIYKVAVEVITLVGPTMEKDQISSIRPILLSACADTQRDAYTFGSIYSESSNNKQGEKSSLLGQESVADSSRSRIPWYELADSLQSAASQLLRHTVGRLQYQNLPPALRTNIDRAIILNQDRDAMLASVLNPTRRLINGKTTSSNLLFLARAYPDCNAVDALLRPRMPVIRTSSLEETKDGMDVDNGESAMYEDGREEVQMQYRIDFRAHARPEHSLHEGGYGDPVSVSTRASEQSQDNVIRSPKRRRAASSEFSAVEPEQQSKEPLPKRPREGITLDLVSESKPSGSVTSVSSVAHAVAEASSSALPMFNIAKNDKDDEDFDIPSLHMPSDLEDSDEDEDEDVREEEGK